MTPTAAAETAYPRGAAARASRPTRASAATVRPRARRVSGAGRLAAAGATTVPGIALPRSPPPPRPRPRSRPGPVRRARSRDAASEGLAARLVQGVARVPDHRLLDRIISGRFWIGLIGFALLGIVAMQLSLLKLNTGIGRALEHEALLQRQNAALRTEVSGLSAGDRVEQQAAQMGMVMAAPGAISFLTPYRGDARHAAVTMSAPSTNAGAPGVAPAAPAAAAGSGQAPATSGTTGSGAPVSVNNSAGPAAAVSAGGATATGAGG